MTGNKFNVGTELLLAAYHFQAAPAADETRQRLANALVAAEAERPRPYEHIQAAAARAVAAAPPLRPLALVDLRTALKSCVFYVRETRTLRAPIICANCGNISRPGRFCDICAEPLTPAQASDSDNDRAG